MPRLRTLLTLGRVSNLPTVWSNCLAGWWLAGGGNPGKLPFLFVGVSALYVGGMFLNDAFDADFDQQYRRERPIPSGHISVRAVWRWGWFWLALGVFCLVGLGKQTVAWGVPLVVCILVYDAIHKMIAFSPVLMGACRFLVYVVAATTGVNGVTGWAMWCGLALMAYVVGLSYLARREGFRGALSYWPLVCLAVPILLALLMNASTSLTPGILLAIVLALWIVRSLSPLWSQERNIGRTVSNLLAGIVLVDLLAVADVSRSFGLIFLMLFVAALVLQRAVPAT